jgi:phosphoglycerate dehydrogenase-like enzyme
MTPSRLIVSVPDPAFAAELADLGERVEVIVWPMDAAAETDRIDLVVPPYMSARDVVARLEGVETRLVQSQSIGYEGTEELLPPGIVFANAATVHETSTAELAVALTLAVQRELDVFARQHDWTRAFTQSLADRRTTVLGFGGVGKAIAARLRPFEVKLRAVATHARTEDGVEVAALEDLHEVLADTEVLILALPASERTRGIIGDAELSALPDGALVVNVGRGTLIDTDALVDHVRGGRIRAGLDVTDPEPLPADHPLWELPGVLISPHVGGASTAMQPRMVALVRRQIAHLLADEEPENVVIRT